MIRFEIKKIFSKSINRMALTVLAVALIIVSILTVNNIEYREDTGGQRKVYTGIAAAKKLRDAKNQWAGPLTEETLAKVIQENNQINNSPESLSGDYNELDKAYAKKQGFSSITQLISSAFSELDDYDYYRADSVTAEEVKGLYQQRITSLENYLASGEESFTDKEKDFLLKQYQELDTPFYYEYENNWEALLQNISTFLLILALTIGFFVSGIFSDEFQLKADSIFFSSRLGRNKAILAKMSAGFLVATALYAVFVCLYTFIVLLLLGTDGSGCPIQFEMWRSSYNITFLQAYLLILAGGYIGTLFSSLAAMIVSAKTRSTALAIIVPFLLLCLFPFLSRIITLPGLCSFFPDQLLEVYIHLRYFVLCEIGGRIHNSVPVLLAGYLIACGALPPVLYLIYKRTEIK
ncbi:MAG: ABC transporter permease [Lachnospiraceae bacterium]|nr:ABC transporter permease [Lachnospiraceae bacterium]